MRAGLKEPPDTRLCSKWFMLALGPHDLHKMLAGFDDKSAEAVCTFAYSEGPGHEPIIFQGRTAVSACQSSGRAGVLTGRRANLFPQEDRRSSVSRSYTMTHSRGAFLTSVRLGLGVRVRGPDVR